jgi:hypothetical protein
MPKSKVSSAKATLLKSLKETEEGQRKIKTIKNSIESKNAEVFEDIFSTIARSVIRTLLGREFYAFEKQVNEPGRFSLNDIDFMADLFEVDKDTFLKFVRTAQKIKASQKKKK